MSLMRQIWTVSALNFRNLRGRLWQSLVIVVGMACVVGVLLSMLSLSEGMHRAYTGTGDPGRAIVVSQGADNEVISHISRDVGAIIATAPGVAKDGAGRPIADPGVLVGVPAIKKRHNSDSYIFMRGFGPQVRSTSRSSGISSRRCGRGNSPRPDCPGRSSARSSRNSSAARRPAMPRSFRVRSR